MAFTYTYLLVIFLILWHCLNKSINLEVFFSMLINLIHLCHCFPSSLVILTEENWRWMRLKITVNLWFITFILQIQVIKGFDSAINYFIDGLRNGCHFVILWQCYFMLVGLIALCNPIVFLCLSGSSGGSGGRENSSNSMGIPLAVPTPSPPSMAPGDCSHFSQWPLALGDEQHHIKMIKFMSIT